VLEHGQDAEPLGIALELLREVVDERALVRVELLGAEGELLPLVAVTGLGFRV